jgi:hypothetical protein
MLAWIASEAELYRRMPPDPDPGEFSGWGWHPRGDVAGWPAGRTDPEMRRFLTKVADHRSASAGSSADVRR